MDDESFSRLLVGYDDPDLSKTEDQDTKPATQAYEAAQTDQSVIPTQYENPAPSWEHLKKEGTSNSEILSMEIGNRFKGAGAWAPHWERIRKDFFVL